MPVEFKTWVISRPLALLFQTMPLKVNAVLNRTLAEIGTRFCGSFTFMQLKGPPGIEVRRRTRSKKRMGFSMPWEMRSSGFYGRIARRRGIHGKRLMIGTRNPAMLIHEFGGTIRPTGSAALAVKIRTERAAQMTGVPVGGVMLRRVVHMKPKLNFISSWRSFVTSVAPVYLARGLKEAVRVSAQRGMGSPIPEDAIE